MAITGLAIHPEYTTHGNALDEPCICGGVLLHHGEHGCDDCPCSEFHPLPMRRIEPSARVPALVAQISTLVDELFEIDGGRAAWVRLSIAKDTGECPDCGGTIDATCICQPNQELENTRKGLDIVWGLLREAVGQ